MFKKFQIINYNVSLQDDERIDILLNINHIVSIKPIKIMTKGQDVMQGYWIRLTNDKKYKAISVPKELLDHFEEGLDPAKVLNKVELPGNTIQ